MLNSVQNSSCPDANKWSIRNSPELLVEVSAPNASNVQYNDYYENLTNSVLTKQPKHFANSSVASQTAEFRWLIHKSAFEYRKILPYFCPFNLNSGHEWKEVGAKITAGKYILIEYEGPTVALADGHQGKARLRWHTRVSDAGNLRGVAPCWVLELPAQDPRCQLTAICMSPVLKQELQKFETRPTDKIQDSSNEFYLHGPIIIKEPKGISWIRLGLRDLMEEARERYQSGVSKYALNVSNPQTLPGGWEDWILRLEEVLMFRTHFEFAPRKDTFDLVLKLSKERKLDARSILTALSSENGDITKPLQQLTESIACTKTLRDIFNLLYGIDPRIAAEVAAGSFKLPGVVGKEARDILYRYTTTRRESRRMWFGVSMLAVSSAFATYGLIKGGQYLSSLKSNKADSLVHETNRHLSRITLNSNLETSPQRVLNLKAGLFSASDDVTNKTGVIVQYPLGLSESEQSRVLNALNNGIVVPLVFIEPLLMPIRRNNDFVQAPKFIHTINISEDEEYFAFEMRLAISAESMLNTAAGIASSKLNRNLLASDLAVEPTYRIEAALVSSDGESNTEPLAKTDIITPPLDYKAISLWFTTSKQNYQQILECEKAGKLEILIKNYSTNNELNIDGASRISFRFNIKHISKSIGWLAPEATSPNRISGQEMLECEYLLTPLAESREQALRALKILVDTELSKILKPSQTAIVNRKREEILKLLAGKEKCTGPLTAPYLAYYNYFETPAEISQQQATYWYKLTRKTIQNSLDTTNLRFPGDTFWPSSSKRPFSNKLREDHLQLDLFSYWVVSPEQEQKLRDDLVIMKELYETILWVDDVATDAFKEISVSDDMICLSAESIADIRGRLDIIKQKSQDAIKQAQMLLAPNNLIIETANE